VGARLNHGGAMDRMGTKVKEVERIGVEDVV
jgi:hypothetical protein